MTEPQPTNGSPPAGGSGPGSRPHSEARPGDPVRPPRAGSGRHGSSGSGRRAENERQDDRERRGDRERRDDGERRRRGSGDRAMVPPAQFRSYYGRPIVRAAPWEKDIPAYLFTGGLAAGSALLAVGGQLTRRTALRRAGRLSAVGAVGLSTYFLVNDLGRPERFLNMLRVAKPTSAMSMGTWILAGFGSLAGMAAAAEAAPLLPERGLLGLVRKMLPPVGAAAGLGAAAFAPALATYTAVLLADTATPSWHAAYPELPFVFAGSSLASGAAVGLLAAPVDQAGPARRMAVLGAGVELYHAHRVETGKGVLSEPYRKDKAGSWLRAARTLTAAGALGALAGRRSRVISALSGVALLAGSALTRFGVYQAGIISAEDPKYTVVPQRERLGGEVR